MAEKAYSIPTTIIRVVGRPISHPMKKEQKALVLATNRMTLARPTLSESVPIKRDAIIPIK